jgi:flagellar hook-associated protein 1 FlgK
MLSLGLKLARDGLDDASRRLQVVSANIANVSQSDASRRVYSGSTGFDDRGHALVARVGDDLLRQSVRIAVSEKEHASRALEQLEQLQGVFGLEDRGLDKLISDLTSALGLYAAAPENDVHGRSVIAVGRELVSILNRSADRLDGASKALEEQVADRVESINLALSRLGELDTAIVRKNSSAADLSDLLDTRDAVLTALAEEISVHVVHHDDASVSVMTVAGSTLFERTPRTVAVAPDPSDGSDAGFQVSIDGLPLRPAQLSLGGHLGAVVGTFQQSIQTLGTQLDEIAAGLLRAFAEVSVVPGEQDRPGLFADRTTVVLPIEGERVVGLAGRLSINSLFDPAAGGEVTWLRDGGSNGSNYVANADGYAGFADRLNVLRQHLTEVQLIDARCQAGRSSSVEALARSSRVWLAQETQTLRESSEQASVFLSSTSALLSREAGIDLDQQLTDMLFLERAFQANSRLIATLDEIQKSLLALAA